MDTVGGKRFKVISKGQRDGYHTAKVEYFNDSPVENQEGNYSKHVKSDQSDHRILHLMKFISKGHIDKVCDLFQYSVLKFSRETNRISQLPPCLSVINTVPLSSAFIYEMEQGLLVYV